MNISGPAAVAKPEMLFYAPGDLTVTIVLSLYSEKGQKKHIFSLGEYPSLIQFIALPVYITLSHKNPPIPGIQH